jgi:sugar lactone lactonase YvrE
MRPTSIFLIVGILASAAVLAQQAPVAPASEYETYATFPSPGATENITQGGDGAIYVTGMDDKVVWRVTSDGMVGSVEKFASIPGVVAVVGVAPNDNGLVITAFAKPFRLAPAGGGPPQINFADVGPEVIVIDKTGGITATIPGKMGQAFNGIARVASGVYLIADSNAATIWRVDIARKRIEPWLEDDALAPGGAAPIGANGIKVRNGYVYVGVSGRSMIYRIPIDGDGRPQDALTKVSEGVRPDDFDVAKDGTIYLSSGMTMYRISPSGEATKMLNNVPGGAATMVSGDGKWVYWPTRGGTMPQRLLRTAIR